MLFCITEAVASVLEKGPMQNCSHYYSNCFCGREQHGSKNSIFLKDTWKEFFQEIETPIAKKVSMYFRYCFCTACVQQHSDYWVADLYRGACFSHFIFVTSTYSISCCTQSLKILAILKFPCTFWNEMFVSLLYLRQRSWFSPFI